MRKQREEEIEIEMKMRKNEEGRFADAFCCGRNVYNCAEEFILELPNKAPC